MTDGRRSQSAATNYYAAATELENLMIPISTNRPRLTALGSAGFSPLQGANRRGRWKIAARAVGRAVKRRERRAPFGAGRAAGAVPAAFPEPVATGSFGQMQAGQKLKIETHSMS